MTAAAALTHDQPDLLPALLRLEPAEWDALRFGVIGFDVHSHRVTVYNAEEARQAELDPADVMGLNVFTELAQCMNNYLVAQRFDDARNARTALDARLDYVLTWRMRPTPVALRMLWQPGDDLAYLVLQRRP
ncbi:phosphonate transporter [Ideonella sp. DXS22W]|uniref:Phosphonate transporter n=1 Tax=Pseudaquabacterium inlustre TaxID=2984192 RepID=A0ABU9CMV6_9BURK